MLLLARPLLVGIALFACLCVLQCEAQPPAPPGKAKSAAGSFESTVLPFVKRYCQDCHSGNNAERKIRLERAQNAAAVADDRETWRKALAMLRANKMPPEDAGQPTREEAAKVVAVLDATLRAADAAVPADPGRVTLRRLNRTEYANTIRDLLGVEFNAAADFPSDDVGYGFDNIGDVLTLSPLLFEKYLAAAEQIAAKALAQSKSREALSAAPRAGVSAEAALEQTLRRLATRAYRRPVKPEELARLVSLASAGRGQGDGPEAGIALALQAMLVSPHFLFRVELDPADPRAGPVRMLGDYELAARLSYFLWSSMPDDELFALAARGALRANLDRQLRRMLADGKSRALVENFAGQWLQLRNLDLVAPDRGHFPAFDDDLRRAMRRESELFFEAILREDRRVLDLLDADFTLVNGRLARHYGIEGVTGAEFRKVSLSGGPEAVRARGGVLTQAAVLAVTSNPTRTSPVKRGKWVLENLLGTPPPDPPPNVPMLQEDAKAVAGGTLRQRMEQHRKNPNCAVCHKEMDAMGFALENFDAVGRWRTKDGELPIDSGAQLPDGRSFRGPRELKALLLANPDQFVRCLAEKTLTYALGRGVEPADRPALDGIVRAAKAGDYKFSALVLAVVHSDPFQKRRGTR